MQQSSKQAWSTRATNKKVRRTLESSHVKVWRNPKTIFEWSTLCPTSRNFRRLCLRNNDRTVQLSNLPNRRLHQRASRTFRKLPHHSTDRHSSQPNSWNSRGRASCPARTTNQTRHICVNRRLLNFLSSLHRTVRGSTWLFKRTRWCLGSTR